LEGKKIRRKSLAILLVPVILTLASMPVALAITLNHGVTFEVHASGPCLAMSYRMNATGGIEELHYAEVGVGDITMIGEALAKGPIPYALPGSNVFDYPTDPKTGTPMYPLAYGYDPGNVSGIGSVFANWTVDAAETHMRLLHFRTVPKPEFGVPEPFAGVIYPESDSLWVPIHYEGINKSYQQISGDTIFISMTSELGPFVPEGLSMIMFGMYMDGGDGEMTVLALIWVNKPTKVNILNPEFPDKEAPAAVIFNIQVELEKTQFSPYVYANVVGGVAMMAVIGAVVAKRRRTKSAQGPK